MRKGSAHHKGHTEKRPKNPKFTEIKGGGSAYCKGRSKKVDDSLDAEFGKLDHPKREFRTRGGF